MARRTMPPALMAKFFKGVEDSGADDKAWEMTLEPRPARLALEADPNAHPKRKPTTIDRRLANMVKADCDSSDSDHEGSRASMGRQKT
jgi:hypothetical protein